MRARCTKAMIVATVWLMWAAQAIGGQANGLAAGVRGLATRAPVGMKIDGNLAEFEDAFAKPVEYFRGDLKNRAAQFFYMWDDEAFYAGLRTLDQTQANLAPDDRLWEGDAVEWYFDTRRGDLFRDVEWGPGAVHCYWTGLTDSDLGPRFCLRPGFLDAIPKIGIEVATRRTAHGTEVEFKLPWANFPNFKPRLNEVIALDAELCYSDGGPRIFRTFTYGNPLGVSQPAALGKVQLVNRLEPSPSHWKQVAAVMMPMRVDLPWSQKTRAHAYGQIAMPVNHADQVGRVVFRIHDLRGTPVADFEATRQVFQRDGNFAVASAHWSIDKSPPAACQILAIIYDKQGNELARVAPRLTSVNWDLGY